jgi:hypothetical protein
MPISALFCSKRAAALSDIMGIGGASYKGRQLQRGATLLMA